MASRLAHNLAKNYASKHWGIAPDAVIEYRDPDLDRFVPGLVQMGTLVELRVGPFTGGGAAKGMGKAAFDFTKDRDPAHLAFSPTRDERLYILLSPKQKADARKALWKRSAPTFLLSELARLVPGRQSKHPYPHVAVQSLGLCTHCTYHTVKLETPSTAGQGGDANYIHEMGEDGGHAPLLGVDSDGRLWFAGGSYRVIAGGIKN